jgi:predicted ferric reductase
MTGYWRAALWIGIYVLLVTAPLVVLLTGKMPPGVEFWWDFAMALGFAGIAMMGIQFALTARFRRVSAPFGIDIIYYFHRYLAIIALIVVLAHFFIIWVAYEEALGDTFDPRYAPWELTMGRAALVLFALAVITSQWRELLRLEYGLWRYSHVAFATFGFAAAVAHIVGVGYYTEAPGKRLLWLLVTLFWIGLLLWVRLVKPWIQLRHPYRVDEVRPERGDAWTLALQPDGHPGIKSFLPGQFAWLTLRASPFALREHPFSMSSAPEALPRLEFTIKALGDFTGTIGEVKPGEVAYLDGPYGVFSIDRYRDAPGFVTIVGGVGITPVISMLRSLAERGDKRPFWLIYANGSWGEVVLREDIEALRDRLDLRLVHVLEKPPEGWEGETGFVTRDIIERHLPPDQRRALQYFLCGPPPMIKAVEEALVQLDVPSDHIKVEIFNLV